MFDDYKNCVLADYNNKKNSSSLSLAIMNPTPASIKAECLRILSSQYLKTDDKMLREFFSLTVEFADYHRIIGGYDIDKFKPLCNFLKGKTASTEPKNIELLAWLIDFQERPYKTDWKPGQAKLLAEDDNVARTEVPDRAIRVEPEDRKIVQAVVENPVVLSTEPKTGHQPPIYRFNRKTILLACVSIIVVLVGFKLWSGREQCMYWSGDRYIPVACDQRVNGATVVAIDRALVEDFRKITKPDTITLRSVGKVWYSKYNNKVEFFTKDGVNPMPPHKELHSATAHIIKKNCLNNPHILTKGN